MGFDEVLYTAQCTILTLLTVTPIMTYAPYRVCSV